MKKIITMFLLLSALFTWQSCGSEQRESEQKERAQLKVETAAQEKADKLAAMRALIVKTSAERTTERNRILAEKAKKSPTYKDASGQIVYYKAEVSPSYTGGMDGLNEYLKKNLNYPAEAREKGMQGTIFVDFVVNKNGNIREVMATDVVGEDVDVTLKEEAVRVVASMPGWTAGRQNDQPVDASFSVPITFELIN